MPLWNEHKLYQYYLENNYLRKYRIQLMLNKERDNNLIINNEVNVNNKLINDNINNIIENNIVKNEEINNEEINNEEINNRRNIDEDKLINSKIFFEKKKFRENQGEIYSEKKRLELKLKMFQEKNRSFEEQQVISRKLYEENCRIECEKEIKALNEAKKNRLKLADKLKNNVKSCDIDEKKKKKYLSRLQFVENKKDKLDYVSEMSNNSKKKILIKNINKELNADTNKDISNKQKELDKKDKYNIQTEFTLKQNQRQNIFEKKHLDNDEILNNKLLIKNNLISNFNLQNEKKDLQNRKYKLIKQEKDNIEKNKELQLKYINRRKICDRLIISSQDALMDKLEFKKNILENNKQQINKLLKVKLIQNNEKITKEKKIKLLKGEYNRLNEKYIKRQENFILRKEKLAKMKLQKLSSELQKLNIEKSKIINLKKINDLYKKNKNTEDKNIEIGKIKLDINKRSKLINNLYSISLVGAKDIYKGSIDNLKKKKNTIIELEKFVLEENYSNYNLQEYKKEVNLNKINNLSLKKKAILNTKLISKQNEQYTINLKNNKNILVRNILLNSEVEKNSNNKNKNLLDDIVMKKDLRKKELYNNNLEIARIRLKKNEIKEVRKLKLIEGKLDLNYNNNKREKVINSVQLEIEKRINSKKDKWIKVKREMDTDNEDIKYLKRENILDLLNLEVDREISKKSKLKNDLSIKRNLLENKYNNRQKELDYIKKQRDIVKRNNIKLKNKIIEGRNEELRIKEIIRNEELSKNRDYNKKNLSELKIDLEIEKNSFYINERGRLDRSKIELNKEKIEDLENFTNKKVERYNTKLSRDEVEQENELKKKIKTIFYKQENYIEKKNLKDIENSLEFKTKRLALLEAKYVSFNQAIKVATEKSQVNKLASEIYSHLINEAKKFRDKKLDDENVEREIEEENLEDIENNFDINKVELELIEDDNIIDEITNNTIENKLDNLERYRSEQISETIYLYMREKAEEICKEKLEQMKKEAEEAMLKAKKFNDEKILADKLANDKAIAYKKVLAEMENRRSEQQKLIEKERMKEEEESKKKEEKRILQEKEEEEKRIAVEKERIREEERLKEIALQEALQKKKLEEQQRERIKLEEIRQRKIIKDLEEQQKKILVEKTRREELLQRDEENLKLLLEESERKKKLEKEKIQKKEKLNLEKQADLLSKKSKKSRALSSILGFK